MQVFPLQCQHQEYLSCPEKGNQVLVQSLVLMRSDYCNLVRAGLPLHAIRPLQMILNAAARFIFFCPHSSSHPIAVLPPLVSCPYQIIFDACYKAKNLCSPTLKHLPLPTLHYAPSELLAWLDRITILQDTSKTYIGALLCTGTLVVELTSLSSIP